MSKRRRAAFAAALLAGAAIAPAAQARPVTFPGGNMAMIEHRDETTIVETIRTLSPRLAVGWHDEWSADEDWQWHGPMLAGLAWRANMPGAQANVFWTAGVGVAYPDVAAASGPSPGAFATLEADWENRRFYTLYQAKALWAESVEATVEHRLRLGVAPYVAEAGALHSWAIVQIDHTPEDENQIALTPVVRLFKGGVLGEAGISLDGDAFASVMFYF